MDSHSQSLYQENIVDHARHPRNHYEMLHATVSAVGDNPSCGDNGNLSVLLDEGEKVIEASFMGVGCAISQAGLSMLTEHIKGKSIQELKRMMPGDIYAMLGVTITPARVNCALLCYRALEQLLVTYDKKEK